MNLFSVTIGGGYRWRRFRLCSDWEPRANPRLITRSVVPQTFRVLNLKLLGLLQQPYKQKATRLAPILPGSLPLPPAKNLFAKGIPRPERLWSGFMGIGRRASRLWHRPDQF